MLMLMVGKGSKADMLHREQIKKNCGGNMGTQGNFVRKQGNKNPRGVASSTLNQEWSINTN